MSLITTLLERPLDPSYAAAAERREAAGLPRATGLRAPWFVAAAVVLGLLLGVAATSLRGSETAKTRARAELVAQIEQRQQQVAEQAQQVVALRSEVTALDTQALATVDAERAARLTSLSVTAGAGAVRGPGFVVTLDDAVGSGTDSPDGDPRTSGEAQDGRVIARDVQIVTNSVWEAGAEAVSVNGQRLTATSAIRFAGDAILVDYRPLARPYVVTSIGDPGALPAAFAGGSGGAYLATLRDEFGIRVGTRTAAEVTVPASGSLATRYALPLDTEGDATGPSPTATPPTPTSASTSGGSP
ncbi:MAG TPA: DUF881 domain-containing protein [Dermatophilaceae bacterium]|nr:DUF881 domain-containing protein [Dermatophilaceae bacterium]